MVFMEALSYSVGLGVSCLDGPISKGSMPRSRASSNRSSCSSVSGGLGILLPLASLGQGLHPLYFSISASMMANTAVLIS